MSVIPLFAVGFSELLLVFETGGETGVDCVAVKGEGTGDVGSFNDILTRVRALTFAPLAAGNRVDDVVTGEPTAFGTLRVVFALMLEVGVRAMAIIFAAFRTSMRGMHETARIFFSCFRPTGMPLRTKMNISGMPPISSHAYSYGTKGTYHSPEARLQLERHFFSGSDL